MKDPDRMISEAAAISTRVAPSFIRVGQLELFGRRARKNEHPKAMAELEIIVLHLIDREYPNTIDKHLSIAEKVVLLAGEFRNRLTALVANWIRVGYCQGNFNSDNCAAGGFTLDYGPFGFCDAFNPNYQPWTGGGRHFSFLNQPVAAERNFHMFCTALRPLLMAHKDYLPKLDDIQNGFANVMQTQVEQMWARKLGLNAFNSALFSKLETLMVQTSVDYTLFFRQLSTIPDGIGPLIKSFYKGAFYNADPDAINQRWLEWLTQWKMLIDADINIDSNAKAEDGFAAPMSRAQISRQMKLVNPKYSLQEWFVVPAYQQASVGSYALVRELQEVMTQPYAEQSTDVEEKYYRLKPSELFELGGLSHYSCSS
tara:strand:- start:903 stop:2012 length:1110 start_codon:yes stop_codon:yes gene_type:complete